MTQPDFIFSRVRWVSLIFYLMDHCKIWVPDHSQNSERRGGISDLVHVSRTTAKNVMSVHFSFANIASLSLTCYVQVDNYEVLVEANLPTRWVYQSLLPPPPLPRPLDQPTVCVDPRSPPQLTLA